MVILGRQIKATEGTVGEGSPAGRKLCLHSQTASLPSMAWCEEMGTSRHCCLATSSSRGLTGNAVTGLAVWSLQMDGGGEGGQLLEMMFWLGGTWAGNATTKKKKKVSDMNTGQTAGKILPGLAWGFMSSSEQSLLTWKDN